MLDAAAAKARAPVPLVAAITTARVTPNLATGRGGPIQTSLVDHVAINVRTSTPPAWCGGGLVQAQAHT